MIKKIGSNKYGVVEYAISSVEDIADLPLGVAIGSTAVLINKDGIRTFALGEGEWVEYIDAERYDKNKLAQDLLFCGFGNDGEKHDDLDDRLMVEFDEINERVNVGNYLEYNGCDVKADYSLEGLQRGVMLEGRTLQNVLHEGMFDEFKPECWVATSQSSYWSFNNGYITIESNPGNYVNVFSKVNEKIKPNTTYTIFLEVKENTLTSETNDLMIILNDGTAFTEGLTAKNLFDVGIHVLKATTVSEITTTILLRTFIYSHVSGGSVTFRYMILEGDHTQTPISEIPYFEGIQSVGQTEGNVVSGKSCGKNLYNGEVINNIALNIDGSEVNSPYSQLARYIAVKPNTNYIFSNVPSYADRKTIIEHDVEKRVIRGYFANSDYSFKTGHNTRYITLYFYKGNLAIERDTDINFQLEEGTTVTAYEPYKETTYSYILDEPLHSLPNGACDTIDFETGVLTRRVGKVVLNENRSWWVSGGVDRGELSIEFATTINPLSTSNKMNLLCDKFYNTTTFRDGGQSICCTGKILYLVILKSNLTSLDSQGIKRWFQDNPTTVYYELAEPTIHQLDQTRIYSFKDTTHIISDNLIAPRITTNILTNSNALISHLKGENLTLANEVSTLSLRNRETQETNETQDHIIDASLCAVDELYMMYETTQEVEVMSADEEGSRMVDMYVAMVQRGLKTIDQVPVRYREKVREILAQLED